MAKKMSKAAEAALYGDEPFWGLLDSIDENAFRAQVDKAYNWYNYMISDDVHASYLFTFLNEHNAKMGKVIKRLPNHKISQPTGWIARMLSRGLYLPTSTYEWFNKEVFDLYDKAMKYQSPVSKSNTPQISSYVEPASLQRQIGVFAVPILTYGPNMRRPQTRQIDEQPFTDPSAGRPYIFTDWFSRFTEPGPVIFQTLVRYVVLEAFPTVSP